MDTGSHEVIRIEEKALKNVEDEQASLDNWWLFMCDFDCRFRDRNYCGLFDDILSYEDCIFQEDYDDEDWLTMLYDDLFLILILLVLLIFFSFLYKYYS